MKKAASRSKPVRVPKNNPSLKFKKVGNARKPKAVAKTRVQETKPVQVPQKKPVPGNVSQMRLQSGHSSLANQGPQKLLLVLS